MLRTCYQEPLKTLRVNEETRERQWSSIRVEIMGHLKWDVRVSETSLQEAEPKEKADRATTEAEV